MKDFKNNIISLVKKIQRVELLLLALLLILSFMVRWRDVNTVPFGIENDEFSFIATSLFRQNNISASDKGVYVTANDSNASIYPVSGKIIDLSFVLFGVDFLSPRKLLVFVDLVSLVFFFFLARRFLSKKTSLLITFFYSFSTYNLITGRIALIGFFSGLFVYPAILLLLSVNPKHKQKNLAYSFLSGALILLSLLTYNLAYAMPLVGILIIIGKSFFDKTTVKSTILLIIFLLLPLILYPQWMVNLKTVKDSKSYALGNAIYDSDQRIINLHKVVSNIYFSKKILFNSLSYNASDMAVNFPGPLVNAWISLAFAISLIIGLLNVRKYLLLLVWFFINFFIYHIAIGTLFARAWFITIGTIYLISGIAFDKVLESNSFKKKYVGYLIIIIISTYVIHKDLYLYYNYAIYNPAFLTSQKELNNLIKEKDYDIGKGLLVVMPEGTIPATNIETAYTALSFYYLASNPEKVEYLKKANKQELGLLTNQEFNEIGKDYLAAKRTIITGNSNLSGIENKIKKINQCLYSTKRYGYFTKLNLNCSESQ